MRHSDSLDVLHCIYAADEYTDGNEIKDPFEAFHPVSQLMRKSGDLGFRRRDPRDVDKSYDNAGDHILDRAVGQDPHDIALGIVGALDMLLHGEESVQDTFGVVLDVNEAKARTYMRNRNGPRRFRQNGIGPLLPG